jgi:APA family basic amino acid/polyamine antiporter
VHEGIAWGLVLAAMVSVLWAYDGWTDVTLVAGELRDPARSYARTILAGTVVLVALYGTVQLAVMRLLPADRAAASTRIVAEAVQAAFGARAGRIVALLVVVSALGSIHGTVLAASRLAFAMAREGAFVRWFGAVHPRWETPARATWALVGGSVVYALSTDFRGLVNYFTFAVWIFYALTGIALLRLRRRGVGDDIAWKAPWGALPPAVLLLTAGAMTSSLLVHDARGALAGSAMIAAGFVLWWARERFLARRGGISPSGPGEPAG